MRISYSKKYIRLSALVIFCITTMVLLSLFKVTYESTLYFAENFAEPQDYVVYYGNPLPTQEGFTAGSTPTFNSFIEYKREVRIHWEERLFCLQEGGWKKYEQIQRFPNEGNESKLPGTMNINTPPDEPLEYWEFYAYPPDPEATKCFVESVVHIETPRGHEKTFQVRTDTFGVNL